MISYTLCFFLFVRCIFCALHLVTMPLGVKTKDHTKMRREMLKADRQSIAQWCASNRLLSGPAGHLLCSVVSGLDALKARASVLELFRRKPESDAKLLCESALSLSGIAVEWSDADMKQCDKVAE